MSEPSGGQKAAGREARRARRTLGLTQQDVADLSGVSDRSIRRFERGVHWPREVAAISEALGYSADALEEYAFEYDQKRVPLSPRVAELLVELDALEEIERRQVMEALKGQESVNTGQ